MEFILANLFRHTTYNSILLMVECENLDNKKKNKEGIVKDLDMAIHETIEV